MEVVNPKEKEENVEQVLMICEEVYGTAGRAILITSQLIRCISNGNGREEWIRTCSEILNQSEYRIRRGESIR